MNVDENTDPNVVGTVRVFDYVPALDAFVVTDRFRLLSDQLGLTEWNPVVWIGRLFTLDNDLGEHWLDNWELRESIATKAASHGHDETDVLIIDPARLADGRDGPCHSADFRKAFWTDVLASLHLSYDVLFAEARRVNAWATEHFPEDHILDLEERILRLTTASE